MEHNIVCVRVGRLLVCDVKQLTDALKDLWLRAFRRFSSVCWNGSICRAQSGARWFTGGSAPLRVFVVIDGVILTSSWSRSIYVWMIVSQRAVEELQ